MSSTDKEKSDFLDEWALLGGPVARKNKLPVSAMLACAAIESGWGKGKIFLASCNPFSLQKWPHVQFPKTHQTYWSDTVVQNTPRIVHKAPFNCATDHADAVRQWCEWVLYYGEKEGPPGNQNPKIKPTKVASAVARREKLLSHRYDGFNFAKLLPTVGFGPDPHSTKYAKMVTEMNLTRYD